VSTEYLHFVELAVNALLVPALWRLASVLWSFNTRLVRIETHLRINNKEQTQ